MVYIGHLSVDERNFLRVEIKLLLLEKHTFLRDVYKIIDTVYPELMHVREIDESAFERFGVRGTDIIKHIEKYHRSKL
jgi:hypothetical protein